LKPLLAILFVVLAVIGIALFILVIALFAWIFRNAKKRSRPLSPQTYRLICCALSAILLAVAISTSVYSTFLLVTGIQTTGWVTGFRTVPDKEHGQERYSPTFKFIDQTGATNVSGSSISRSTPLYHVGDLVPVIYRPANPSSARINSFEENWMTPIITTLFATIILASIPVRNIWLAYRSRNNSPAINGKP
jgi:hypothetical protein